MPEMDGHAVLKAVRAAEEAKGDPCRRRQKVIMTTSLSDKGNVFTAFREMCDGYLVKPIDRTKLLGCLTSLGLTS